MKIRIKRVEGLMFTGVGDTQHWVNMDTLRTYGGTEGASKPKELFLMGIAGCTAMDVASILDKMRMKYDDLEVSIEAEEAEVHPKVFTNIRLEYRFTGRHLDKDKIEKAIELSGTKYCALSAMMKQVTDFQSTYTLIEDA